MASTHTALSLAHGPDLVLSPDSNPILAKALEARVLAYPEGVLRACRRDGTHDALSYRDVWDRSARVAAGLQRRGVRPGRAIVLLIEDQLAFAAAFWACLRGGFIAVPLAGALRAAARESGRAALTEILNQIDNPILIADGPLVEMADPAVGRRATAIPLSGLDGSPDAFEPNSPPADPLCLFPTSGSTGRVKLVALSPSVVRHRHFAVNDGGKTNIHHVLSTFPVDSISNMASLFLRHRSWTHLSPASLAAVPRAICEAVEAFGITSLSTNAAVAAALVAAGEREGFTAQLGTLRAIGLGSEPVVRSVVERLDRLLVRHGAPAHVIRAGYGTTETGILVIGSNPLAPDNTAESGVSLGGCAPGVALRIVDDAGNVVPEGETGEVQVHAPQKIFAGYWLDDEATRKSFTADGWWRTGDLGLLRKGELTLRGRTRDVIIVHGKKFSLADIDAELSDTLGSGGRAFSCAVHLPGQDAEQLAIAFEGEELSVARQTAMASQIRSAITRRFGLYADPVKAVDAALIPRTSNGKLRRAALAGLFLADQPARQGNSSEKAAVISRPALVERLSTIWRDALALNGPLDAQASFFELGGDSLRALTLHLQIVDAFGVHIGGDEFFADPTFQTLLALVEALHASPPAPHADSTTAWPLPRALHHRLLAPLETWPGERVTRERMVLGFNTAGTRPPVFWVFNVESEPAQLAQGLGADQPLYAFRSGAEISDYDENEIQAFALRYMAEIEQVCPRGPFFIGGNCQGGIIALAIAQHALRRKRHVPLLILMSWSFEIQPYAGRVLLISGRDEAQHNARRLFTRPELAWRRAFAAAEFVELPGSFAFEQRSMPELTELLMARMRAAISAASLVMPRDAYRTRVIVDGLPQRTKPLQRFSIGVTVRNDSDLTWPATPLSGLTVGIRWTDADGDVIPMTGERSDLPEIAPHGEASIRMEISAPGEAGEFRLHVDICEEGERWFNVNPETAFSACVVVERHSPSPRPAKRAFWRLTREKHRYAFGFHSPALELLTFGWGPAEEWGTWSVRRRAKLRLPLADRHGRWRVRLTCQVFGPHGAVVPVLVRIGYDNAETAWNIKANTTITKPIDIQCPGTDMTVQFRLPDAVSPRTLGYSADPRKLGIGLVALELMPV